jgi:hypothetical protein
LSLNLKLLQSPVIENNKFEIFPDSEHKAIHYDKGMYVTVFSLDTMGDYIIPANYRWWVVDEVGPTTCKAESKFMNFF